MREKPRPATQAVRLGLHPERHRGIVNPPVYHASTVLFPTLAELEASYGRRHEPDHVHYGIHGTPTTFALEEALAGLEGAAGAVILCSGLAAVTTAIMTYAGNGDHILVTDSAYDPTRAFCDRVLARFGVTTTYYDPLIGARIEELFRANTRLVFMESPGSLTFEVQDVAAIAAAAAASGIVPILDNTWATPLYFRPFDHGVAVSIQAGTKYLGGHSDLMLGSITSTAEHLRPLRDMAARLGHCAAPDDCYLALRGLRSLPVRLERHYAHGLRLARWLQGQPEVVRVLHPALETDPGHALWRRDFTGACGLFGVVLAPLPRPALAALLDGLALFGMGYSWGGFESLVIPASPERSRSARPWRADGPLLRIHAGLEDPVDLIADLEAGFARLRAARVDSAARA